MELLLGTNHLGLGGSESYLLTVAEQLDRLGHRVTIFAPEPGAGVAAAHERCLEVVDDASLPAECDAALVQDGGVAYQLAERYPSAPQLFVAHSESINLQAPPQLDGVVGTIVVLNDRVGERMRSFAVETPVVRLRQPIDTERFLPMGSSPETPRRLLLFSNYPSGGRLEMLESACADLGIELDRLGGPSRQTRDPRGAIAAADIVVGYGRSILEAMACGRAAYVYDLHGGDGWMTADSYAAIEADGIAGRSGRKILNAADLADDLSRYEASMGPVNHDLMIANHRANVHAQGLVELLRDLRPRSDRSREPLQEMARLVRMEWRARSDVYLLRDETEALRVRVRENEESTEERIRKHGRAVEAQVRRSYESSTSWRLTAPLRRLTERWRRFRS